MLQYKSPGQFQAVVIGASAGGGQAIRESLSNLSQYNGPPILIVMHLHPSDEGLFAQSLQRNTSFKVNIPCDKDPIKWGEVFVAPANYHMLAERDETIALSVDEKVNYTRPSIDVLFESAAYAWGKETVGILLTGSNQDGAQGLLAIRTAGGLTVAQDPSTAEYPLMPQSAINVGAAEHILSLEAIAVLLRQIGAASKARNKA